MIQKITSSYLLANSKKDRMKILKKVKDHWMIDYKQLKQDCK